MKQVLLATALGGAAILFYSTSEFWAFGIALVMCFTVAGYRREDRH